MEVYYNPVIEALKDIRVWIITNLLLTCPELKRDAWLYRRDSRPGVQVLSTSRKEVLRQIKIVYPERAKILCRDYNLYLVKADVLFLCCIVVLTLCLVWF